MVKTFLRTLSFLLKTYAVIGRRRAQVIMLIHICFFFKRFGVESVLRLSVVLFDTTMNPLKMMTLLAVKHMRDIRVLDWHRLQNWNYNIPPRFNNNTVPVMESRFSRIKKMIQETPDSYSKEKLPPRVRYHLMELENTTPSIASMDQNELLRIKKRRSSNAQALLQLTLKKSVGQMKICSLECEFSGPEKGLFVVRESVLYSMLEGELAAIIVKNSSGETCGDMESRSRTTIVVLPDRVHSWPISGSPSTLINRWRSGGACDRGGWDIGYQFHQNEIIITPSTSNHLELCYQVGNRNKCSFRLVSVADGLYSLEYDPSMSLLQAFSICVAVVSSHKLTHIFQVNHVTPESKDLSKPIPTDNEKAKSWVSKPPASLAD
ncbi:hypothetical protein L1987_41219 [Smallanthus sonchifolius]|uniref:Uncharacterized protein n=1 Tax=Smallanthus sonchifolius TaxID=185202 RepID=A0ACB9GVI6_9ASTR|nr:hypothetical protein L1987_41219 [Smallanthus sonchifolius]